MAKAKKPLIKKGAMPIQPIVKLEDHLLLQVDGAQEKKHALSWEIFKKIGDSTQALIEMLVRYSTDDHPIDHRSLKIEIIGFHEGSAVPELRLAAIGENLFPKAKAFQSLNRDFSFVLTCVNKGNFQAVADKYIYPEVKNQIIDAVYDFTNAAGTKPFNIVERNKENPAKFKTLAKVRYMKSDQRDSLKVPLIGDLVHTQVSETKGVGSVIVKISKKGRKSTIVDQFHTEKEASLSLILDSIETNKRIYLLKHQVLFSFVEDPKKKSVTIEDPLLDLYAYGETMQLAKDELFYQFDSTYQRLNQIPDNQLSKHLVNAKIYINMIVDTVKDK